MHSAIDSARQLVQALKAYGIRRVVISPGSRNAPLVIELNAEPFFELFSVVDERSAAFFALGMSKTSGEAVALVCTSGSAVLNYYPAVAEAFNSAVPLLVVSADRPARMIGIGEGQTIFQHNVLQPHTLFSTQIDGEDAKADAKLLNRSLDTLVSAPGPVHINIPFDEPLYGKVAHAGNLFVKENHDGHLKENPPLPIEPFTTRWNTTRKKMILFSGIRISGSLRENLSELAERPDVVLLSENTASFRHPGLIDTIDRLVFMQEEAFEEYRPELLITFGGVLISKKIKYLLRKYPPAIHWHIDPWRSWDTFGVLTRHIAETPADFFERLTGATRVLDSGYAGLWKEEYRRAKQKHDIYASRVIYSDFWVFDSIHRLIPQGVHLEFSNSTPIRYAQLFSWIKNPVIQANRGTSGIDGSLSTAVGASVVSAEPVLFVTGDLAFYYDINGLWNSALQKNFKIVLINNGGGGIFRFIPGPVESGALEYFETPHEKTARHIAAHYGMVYLQARGKREFELNFKELWQTAAPALLEVFTPSMANAEVLRDYFQFIAL